MSFKMDQDEKVNEILKKVKKRVIEKNDVVYLRNFSLDKSKWLKSMDRLEIMQVSEAFKSFFVEAMESSKSEHVVQEVTLLLLETLACRQFYASVSFLAQCIRPICDYLKETIELVANNKKANRLKKILTMLHYFNKCVKNGDISFKLCTDRLLKTSLETALFRKTLKDLQKECLNLVVVFSKTDDACGLITTLFKDNLVKQPSQGKMLNSWIVGKNKVSAATYLLCCIVQLRLGTRDVESEIAFKNAFKVAANLVVVICQELEDNKNKMSSVVGSLIDDLLAMMHEPMMPAAGFVLQMFIKKMCSYIQKDCVQRLKVFAIKQLPKVALALKRKEALYEETYQCAKSTFGSCFVGAMKLRLINYIKGTKVEESCGNVAYAYQALWSHYLPDTVSNIRLDGEAWKEIDSDKATAAAFFIECSSSGHAGFDAYVKYVLLAAANTCKTVKSAAVKSLSELITAEPSVLRYPLVGAAMADCVTSASATGREALVKVLARFLITHVDATPRYSEYLLQFLDDQSLIVRRAAVAAVTSLFKAHPVFARRSELAFKVLSMARDPEEGVQVAVYKFFSSTWLDYCTHLDCLVEISASPMVREFVATLLMQRRIANRAICLSQKHKLLEETDHLPEERLKMLISAITMYLQVEVNVRRRSSAASILLALVEVHPHCLQNQAAALKKILFEPKIEGDKELKKILCRILVLIVPYLAIDERNKIKSKIHECLKKDVNFEMPTSLLASFLKLLIAVSINCLDELRDLYVLPSLDLLRKSQINEEEQVKDEVKRSLCLLIYLWKDYAQDCEVNSLVLHYLKDPHYNLTVLSILSEARLEVVPSRTDPYLNKLITKYLESQNISLVMTALHFISCALKGYQNVYQKPEMKTLGNSTTEAVSLLLQNTLSSILRCVFHTSSDVRLKASSVISLIVQTGLILMPRLLPHLIAMTTDPDNTIKKLSCRTLDTAVESWDISIFALDGMRLALNLAYNLKLEKETIRGFDEKTWTSTCIRVYEFVKKTPERVRKLIDVLIKAAEEEKDDFLSLFLMDQVIFFPYKTVGEVHHVVNSLRKTLSTMAYQRRDNKANLFQKGEKWMLSAYKAAFQNLIQRKFVMWTKETVHRSKTVGDYVTTPLLAVLKNSEACNDNVRALAALDEDPDPDMTMPLAELKEKNETVSYNAMTNCETSQNKDSIFNFREEEIKQPQVVINRLPMFSKEKYTNRGTNPNLKNKILTSSNKWAMTVHTPENKTTKESLDIMEATGKHNAPNAEKQTSNQRFNRNNNIIQLRSRKSSVDKNAKKRKSTNTSRAIKTVCHESIAFNQVKRLKQSSASEVKNVANSASTSGEPTALLEVVKQNQFVNDTLSPQTWTEESKIPQQEYVCPQNGEMKELNGKKAQVPTTVKKSRVTVKENKNSVVTSYAESCMKIKKNGSSTIKRPSFKNIKKSKRLYKPLVLRTTNSKESFVKKAAAPLDLSATIKDKGKNLQKAVVTRSKSKAGNRSSKKPFFSFLKALTQTASDNTSSKRLNRKEHKVEKAVHIQENQNSAEHQHIGNQDNIMDEFCVSVVEVAQDPIIHESKLEQPKEVDSGKEPLHVRHSHEIYFGNENNETIEIKNESYSISSVGSPLLSDLLNNTSEDDTLHTPLNATFHDSEDFIFPTQWNLDDSYPSQVRFKQLENTQYITAKKQPAKKKPEFFTHQQANNDASSSFIQFQRDGQTSEVFSLENNYLNLSCVKVEVSEWFGVSGPNYNSGYVSVSHHQESQNRNCEQTSPEWFSVSTPNNDPGLVPVIIQKDNETSPKSNNLHLNRIKGDKPKWFTPTEPFNDPGFTPVRLQKDKSLNIDSQQSGSFFIKREKLDEVTGSQTLLAKDLGTDITLTNESCLIFTQPEKSQSYYA